jgi:hypothetical protein
MRDAACATCASLRRAPSRKRAPRPELKADPRALLRRAAWPDRAGGALAPPRPSRTLQRACEVQLATHANGATAIPVTLQAIRASQQGRDEGMEEPVPTDRMVFDALIREIDRLDPSYKT